MEIKENCVSFYLMPVCMCPDLLAGMSKELKQRMQGKSYFNFKAEDPTLFNELAESTKRCLKKIQDEKSVRSF